MNPVFSPAKNVCLDDEQQSHRGAKEEKHLSWPMEEFVLFFFSPHPSHPCLPPLHLPNPWLESKAFSWTPYTGFSGPQARHSVAEKSS